jgi:tetratricopeptide (TPR) repeat protein
MSFSSRQGLWLLEFLAVIAAALIVLAVWRQHYTSGKATTEASTGDFPLPPYSTSRYLNTGPDARYVGIAVCAECHPKKHQSYQLTPHAQALSNLDPKEEPPDGSFHHRSSGRTYRVYRRDGTMRHEEVVRDQNGNEIARVDLPIRYLIGSGHFCRTYIVETDGFLQESPITWYASKKKWDMSPGYDFPHHWGFERGTQIGCLSCHAGRLAQGDDTVHRFSFREQAIGCENCHGPGSLHAELHRAKKYVAGTEDLTIVNPARLPRQYLEAVCAVCHRSGPGSVLLRGRKITDYRPGMPLTDYRIDYRFDGGNEQMTVVGHIEQLRQSACYEKSGDLTCLTCHDPHANEKPKDPIGFYRQKCLDCHAHKGCKLQRAERLKKEPADNCSACHMPRGDTDIPHVAFTHHRIGRHARQPQRGESSQAPHLVPAEDVSHLSPVEQKRNLGLAYIEASKDSHYARWAATFSERAQQLLEDVRAAGLRDAETAEGLAEIYYYRKKDADRASICARDAIMAPGASAETRALAMTILASREMEDRNFDEARKLIEQLMRLRRLSHDRRLLGLCFLEQDKPHEALAPLREALAMRPYRPVIHEDLARVYDQLGDPKRAAEHRFKAKRLREHDQE